MEAAAQTLKHLYLGLAPELGGSGPSCQELNLPVFEVFEVYMVEGDDGDCFSGVTMQSTAF